MKIGVIDIGTLSLRFDIFGPHGHGSELSHRAMPRLGELVFRDGALGQEGVERLHAELTVVRELARAHGVNRVAAVGTSVFRDASDSADVLRAVEAGTGITVQILSGHEEAELTARGILAFEDDLQPEFVTTDIGGGSTEITWCRGGRPERSMSVDLGVIRLRESHFEAARANGRALTPNELAAAREVVRTALAAAAEPSRLPTEMVGSSGTVRAFERLGFVSPPPDRRVATAELVPRVAALLRLSPSELLAVPGIEASRADVVPPGCVIVVELIAHLSASTLKVSHFSLRHGVLDAVRSGSDRVWWLTLSPSVR